MPSLVSHILEQPPWLLVWLFWLGLVNMGSLAFLREVPARWVLTAFLLNLVFMTALCEWNGYNRLLGLSHVLFWTPLLVYLFRIRRDLPQDGAAARWFPTLMLTNAVSLVVDYVDVGRYLLGERS